MIFKPSWLKIIPNHLRPEKEVVKGLEQLRAQFNIPHNLFGLRVLSSPSTTVKAQRYSYEYFKKKAPGSSERELLLMVLEERLQTPPVTKMSRKEIDKAMENINSFEDLCDYVMALDEMEPATPDPLGIGKRIDEILKEGLNAKLLEAATKGDLSTVESLIEEGAYVDARDEKGLTPLIWASANNHVNVVTFLIENGADVNVKHSFGSTALISATMNGCFEVIKILITNGADVNAKICSSVDFPDKISGFFEGRTALMEASFSGHRDTVDLLIEKGADINAKDERGETALHHSISFKTSPIIVKKLLESGAGVNVQDNDGNPPLFKASRYGPAELVKILLDYGTNVNLKDKYGYTPLMEASGEGYAEIVKLLLESGADINDINIHGQNALALTHPTREGLLVKKTFDKDSPYFHQKYKYKEVRKILQKAGAVKNPFIKSRVTSEKLHTKGLFAAIEECDISRVKEIIRNGVDLNAENDKNIGHKTPLMDASENGNITLIKLLLENGAKINAQNKFGMSALLWASAKGQADAVIFLIKKAATINAKNTMGWNALMLAATSGNVKIVKTLLDSGLEINEVDNRGWTPLIIASKEGKIDVVKFLVDKKADFDLKDDFGKTALMYAYENGHFEVVDFLKRAGARYLEVGSSLYNYKQNDKRRKELLDISLIISRSLQTSRELWFDILIKTFKEIALVGKEKIKIKNTILKGDIELCVKQFQFSNSWGFIKTKGYISDSESVDFLLFLESNIFEIYSEEEIKKQSLNLLRYSKFASDFHTFCKQFSMDISRYITGEEIYGKSKFMRILTPFLFFETRKDIARAFRDDEGYEEVQELWDYTQELLKKTKEPDTS